MTSVRSSRSACEPLGPLAALEAASLVGQARLDLSPGLVQTASGFGAVRGLERDEALMGPGQRRALAQELGLQLVERRQGGDRGQLAQRPTRTSASGSTPVDAGALARGRGGVIGPPPWRAG